MHLISETCNFQIPYVIFKSNMYFVWTEYYMLEEHVIFPLFSMNYMFSVNYIFFMNITYIFAIITCLGFLVSIYAKKTKKHFAKKAEYRFNQ